MIIIMIIIDLIRPMETTRIRRKMIIMVMKMVMIIVVIMPGNIHINMMMNKLMGDIDNGNHNTNDVTV